MGDSLSYLDNLLILNNSRVHFLDPFQMGAAKRVSQNATKL